MNYLQKTISVIILLLAVHLVGAQSMKISGVVTAAEDGYPLPGVNVIVQGVAGQGTITDLNGKYSISVPQGKSLVFKYVGYKDQTILIKQNSVVNVVMESDSKMLEEVVAIGYGTMKKSDLTGSVVSVKSDALQKTPAAGMDQALQGRAAGVTVNTNSGQPGASAEVRIRGIGTVNGSSPVYVVDGVMVSDISFLSPNDIESTEILKDASATAIYGSRGANGVILVTTKKGKAGSSKIDFDAYYGVQNRWNKLSLMKSKEFAKMIIDLKGTDSEIDYYNSHGFNKWLSAYRLGKSSYFPNNLDYSSIETDWQDEVFNENAPIQNYNLTFSGSNDKTTFSLSGNYFNQDGTIIGSNYERLGLRINTSSQIKKWLKVGENLAFMHATGRNAMNNNSSPMASVLSAALAMAPWDPTHYPTGSVNNLGEDLSGHISASSNFKTVTNPYSMLEMSHPEDIYERWVGDVFLDITPIKGLVIHSDVNMDLSNNSSRLFKEAYEYSFYDKNPKNYLSSTLIKYSTVVLENTATYTKDFGKHSLTAMVGQTTEEYNYYSIGGSGSSILNPVSSNWYLSQTTDDQTNASDAVSRTRRFSLLSTSTSGPMPQVCSLKIYGDIFHLLLWRGEFQKNHG